MAVYNHPPGPGGGLALSALVNLGGGLRRGDLIFFFDGGGVYHVGVYAGFRHGHRRVLHAPYAGTRVRTERIWTDRWFAGTLRYR